MNHKSYEIRVVDRHYRPDQDEALPARIYQPLTEGPLPAVISVHGGAWSGGNHTTNAYIDKALAQSGLLVFSMACRTAPAHPYPAQVQDVNLAVRWLKAHAEAFNINPRCMGGLGTSSGGHSLFLAAMRPEDPRYTALPLPDAMMSDPMIPAPHDARLSWLIGAWPVLDPWARYRFARENKIEFLTERTEGYFPNRETMEEGNPQLALERGEALDLPPVLMIEGTADENLPPGAAARFAQSYTTAGGEARLALFDGMPHSFALAPGAESDRALDLMKSFIFSRIA